MAKKYWVYTTDTRRKRTCLPVLPFLNTNQYYSKEILLIEKFSETEFCEKLLTVFRDPFTCMNLPSDDMDLERSLKMQSSKSTVLPLPVGAEITMFTSE
jgi:hypothetical protein